MSACDTSAGIVRFGLVALGLVLAGGLARGELATDWAYHASASDLDERATEHVPGSETCFVGGCSVMVSSEEPVLLHVLTQNDFAGDAAEEQVWVRWWNGTEARWIQGKWEANIQLGGTGEAPAVDYLRQAGSFRGLPSIGTKVVDLWTVEISPEDTAPGTNYYTIQLKGAGGEGGDTVLFLVRSPIGDAGAVNNLGQAWTATEDETYGHDWSVEVVDKSGASPVAAPAVQETTPEVPAAAQ